MVEWQTRCERATKCAGTSYVDSVLTTEAEKKLAQKDMQICNVLRELKEEVRAKDKVRDELDALKISIRKLVI